MGSQRDSSIKLMDYSSQNTKQSKYTTGYHSGRTQVEDFGIEEKKTIFVNQSLIEMVDQVHSTRQEHILRYSTLSSEKKKATSKTKEINELLEDLRRRNSAVNDSRVRYSTAYRANEKRKLAEA